MTSTNVFKIASSSVKNISTLLDTNIWGFPSEEGSYKKFIEKAEIGDPLIFTNRGEVVAVGELASLPNGELHSIFPDGKICSSTFTVNIEKFGRIPRALNKARNLKLPRGSINLSNKSTYKKCWSILQYSS